MSLPPASKADATKAGRDTARMEALYFPNLNGLRFLAALLVIVHHLEQLKALRGLPNAWSSPPVFMIGKLGVILFFVLSGFLITYLLMEEERVCGRISVGRFYARRILGIWPLYFLVVLLAFGLLPTVEWLRIEGWSEHLFESTFPKLMLFGVMLPNLALILYPPVPYAAQTWSIGTEEQFYLLWPLLMRTFRGRRVGLLWGVVVGLVTLRGLALVALPLSGNAKQLGLAISFLEVFNIECMAIGGLFACVAFAGDGRLRRFLVSRPVEVGAAIVAMAGIGFGVQLPFLRHEPYAVLFGIVILNAATNPRTLVRLELRPLDYLGRISYGLYMFHPLAIGVTLAGLVALGVDVGWQALPVAVGLTVLLSSLSYEYFERPFLKLKNQLGAIVTGDAVRRRGPESATALGGVAEAKRESA